jgi:acetyl-CoA acetyltransferase
MSTSKETLQATERGTSVARGHPRERTGVRFVLTNTADLNQTDD